jgi:hypothetical protein
MMPIFTLALLPVSHPQTPAFPTAQNHNRAGLQFQPHSPAIVAAQTNMRSDINLRVRVGRSRNIYRRRFKERNYWPDFLPSTAIHVRLDLIECARIPMKKA